MVASISPDPRLQFFANDGSPLVGGKLYTYAAGTTTPLATYTTITGLIANTNPIILDSRGEASVWFSAAKYKFVLKTAADVEIWTQDNLWAAANVDGSNATGTWPINISGSAASVVPGGAVNKLIAGTNITISPGSGVGDVTVNATASGTLTSINGAGLYGFTLPGGPITSSGTLTVTPPAPSTAGNLLTSNGTAWISQTPTPTPSNGAKAWVNFNGTLTGTISPRASYNVSSVTKNSTGNYAVNFTTALTDANYAISGSCSQNNGSNGYGVLAQYSYTTAPTTTAAPIITVYCAGNEPIDCNFVSVTIFGN